jgi:Bacterial inner membrane protein.
MNNIIAQIMSFFGTLSNIVGIQFKKKKHILVSIICANFLFSVSFILLKAYSGALICFIAGIQTIINSLFDSKGKKYPTWLIISYYIISISCVFITFVDLIDIIPVMCAVLLITIIIQTKEKNVRLLTLINIGLWTVYDFIVGAYVVAISNIFVAISTLVAIIRLDILKIGKK